MHRQPTFVEYSAYFRKRQKITVMYCGILNVEVFDMFLSHCCVIIGHGDDKGLPHVTSPRGMGHENYSRLGKELPI